jgi:phage terminase small subunit
MSALRNQRHESFAQLLAAGIDHTDAYEQTGYAANASHAVRLRDRPDVQERVAELTSEAAQAAGITPDRLLRELMNIATANAGDYFAWDIDGVAVKPSDMLTRDQMAAVCQVEETRLRGERTIKVRMADKLAAIRLLGQHLKMFGAPSSPGEENHLHLHVQSPLQLITERLALLASRAVVGRE